MMRRPLFRRGSQSGVSTHFPLREAGDEVHPMAGDRRRSQDCSARASGAVMAAGEQEVQRTFRRHKRTQLYRRVR